MVDVYRIGCEWTEHSLGAITHGFESHCLFIAGGGPEWTKLYRAILVLKDGAKAGGFAHNTGEGGLNPCHLEKGGDIIWQIGEPPSTHCYPE